MSKIDVKQIKAVADKSEIIGDKAFESFNKSNKIEAGKLAIAAFKNTLYANSLLIKNEKI
jgi:hypothetical protein